MSDFGGSFWSNRRFSAPDCGDKEVLKRVECLLYLLGEPLVELLEVRPLDLRSRCEGGSGRATCDVRRAESSYAIQPNQNAASCSARRRARAQRVTSSKSLPLGTIFCTLSWYLPNCYTFFARLLHFLRSAKASTTLRHFVRTTGARARTA